VVLTVPVTSQGAYLRSLFSFPVVLSASLSYLVFFLSRRNIADPDLWWHLRNAQELLRTGHFVVADSYSFTAQQVPVLPFEWLSELLYYCAFKMGGLDGIFVLVFLLTTALVLGVFRLCYLTSGDIKNSFIASVGTAMLTSVSSGARTLLLGWLCLVALLLIIEQVRSGSWRRLALVPPLFSLWVNLHASWAMGMAVFGVYIASGLIDGEWGQVYAVRWSAVETRRLLVTAVTSIAALLLNPFGLRMVQYPFRVLFGGSSGSNYVQEFAPVDLQSTWGTVVIVLLAAILLAALCSRVRWRVDEVAFVMIAIYFSLHYLRFIYLAGILLAPVFARRLKLMTEYEPATDRRLPNVVALAVIFCMFVLSIPRQFENPVKYPEGALAYIKSNGLQGRVFHDWVWGGYLIWNAPQLRVFVDGRGDPYAASGVVADYLAAAYNQNPQYVLDKYRVEYVLMPVESVMARALEKTSSWTVLYQDSTSVLLRRSPPS
jgi:hypothetical protein